MGEIKIMGDITIHISWEENSKLSVYFRFHGRNYHGKIKIMGDIIIHISWEENRKSSVYSRFHGRNAVRRVRTNAA